VKIRTLISPYHRFQHFQRHPFHLNRIHFKTKVRVLIYELNIFKYKYCKITFPMWTVLRAQAGCSSRSLLQPWKLGFPSLSTTAFDGGVLDLQEIQKILTDVQADDVKIIPAPKHNDWTDFMVLATGRSSWHVKNIAQALIYQARSFVTSSSSSHVMYN